ncbi:NAD(P)-binding protein [Phanerochaete sordida]|uniref:NAD(P)-binding protein n=1 Tax=Phanerochaete sordida TaxID=48140 RepID=A0A9P3GUA4_9APHY|nr:NAD(P)-binding protein [Phanerochaete sordida]
MTTEPSTLAASQPIAVIGATGTQGLAVLTALLATAHPVRALTRSPHKLAGLAAAHANLAVVETDIGDPGSLSFGFLGAWALFVNTRSDYALPAGSEEALLRGIVDAARESEVRWLVMSVLPEGVPARAYEEKARAMRYAREVAVKGRIEPIFVQMGWYMSGFSGYMKPVVHSVDGVTEFRWSTITPDTLFPLVDSADLGLVVRAILDSPEEWADVEVPVVGDVLTIPQVARIYSEVTGQPARAVFVDHVPQESIPQWVARHSAYRDAGYFPKYVGRESEIPTLARKLVPEMKSFAEWLKQSGFVASAGDA